MQELNLEKEIQDYLDSVYVISHSRHSVDVYRSGIDHLAKFVQEKYQKPLEEIILAIKQGQLDVYQVFKHFVTYLDKAGKKPASIKIWVVGAKGFLRHCEIKIYSEDFRMAVRLPRKRRQKKEPLTKEIILRVLNNTPPKLRTIILVAVVSGMRIGEIIQLKLSDVDFDSKPTKIRIRAETTKTKESRETFLTSEATNSLKDYLTRYFGWKEDESSNNMQDLAIFGRTNSFRKPVNERKKTFQQTNSSILANSLREYIKSIPELSKLNENGRHMIHFHAFREYFRTVMGNAAGRDYAEALMGHRFYLDSYYNLSKEKKQEMYLKAEPELTISDYVAINKKLDETIQRQKEIEFNQTTFMKIIKEGLGVPPEILERVINETK